MIMIAVPKNIESWITTGLPDQHNMETKGNIVFSLNSKQTNVKFKCIDGICKVAI